ncbi:MAG TPA: ribonuclease III [Beijerinckiaceae bacterium]
MSRRTPHDLALLEEQVGHRFASPALLTQALTHVSAGPGLQSYQRLEFLGDRVLGLCIAQMLYDAYPTESEGELSRRLSELVRRETCAAVAQDWGIGPFLRLAGGATQGGGRTNPTILSDVCESVLGAVFLDGGYSVARAVVERAFGAALAAPRRPVRDPKTALQEWAQGRGLPAPIYATVERSGPDHAPSFGIAARIQGVPEAVGRGPSKRVAEQEAARALLLREGVWTENGHE